MTQPSPLSLFHPLIQAWFREKVGVPTDIQEQAWPRIAAGSHVLLTAPTGSGKTLTAFLWALDRFATGAWAAGATRILYVSPLKALNNDIQRNLVAPLEAIRARFADAGESFPQVRVMVRSGDTPAGDRRRMLRHPPEILITTPESLNLLLLSPAGRDSLGDLSLVILDEIHAVAGTKRGTHLITAVDRLVPLAGEFQRVCLSATVKPLETVAAWAGGYILGETGYVPRQVELIRSKAAKAYALRVRYPVAAEGFGRPPQDRIGAAPEPGGDGAMDIWAVIAAELKERIAEARSTLIFANNRRLSERLARLINDGGETPLAYAHHGSLSREIRAVVEARMKEGSLPAIVATNSLELGIDVGALDQVILVQTPFSIASALQKIGRAGHGVGQTSRGILYASHGKDLLDAAATVKCVLTGDLEDTRIVDGPLDLLAQILLSMAVSGEWTLDGLYAFVRTSHPYRHLARSHFDLVAEMLAGRFEATRIRELRPRLTIDAVDGRVRAAKGAALALALSGGTIPDRGLYALRHAETRSKIGELDEEFVWERREGDMFALGNQSWRIVRITANEVEVAQADRPAQMAPFWRAEERDRGFHVSRRLGEFLETADGRLRDPDLKRALETELMEERGLERESAEILIGYLRRQQEATGAPLPHRRHLLIEDAGAAPDGAAPGGGAGGARAGQAAEGRQVILHAVWGGRLNRPWAYALAAAFEEKTGVPLSIITGDDCLLVTLPEGQDPAALIDMVRSDNLETLLRKSLENTGWFAAHFRENAARALLLPRSTARSRVPLWLNRIRSRNLLQAVAALPDFPIVLETWRECLRDEFDLPALKAMLDEVHAGTIRVTEARTSRPSPFAESLVWKRTNQNMYEQDKPAGEASARGLAGGRADLLREIAFSAPLRPRIPREVIADFEAKAQRLAPGYAPQDASELVEWVKERLLIPWAEWLRLLPLCGGPEASGDPETRAAHHRHLASRLIGVRLPGAETPAVAAVESLPRLWAALGAAVGDATLFHALEGTASAAPVETRAHLARLGRAGAASPRDPGSPQGGGSGDAEGSEAAAGPRGAPLTAHVAQWLRAYGPVSLELPKGLFGTFYPQVQEALEELAGNDGALLDTLTEGAAETEACDAANLEILLRLMRRRSRPEFRTLPVERLPLFLAAWQGVAAPARDVEGLQNSVERLFGYPAPAAAWEADILPARSFQYLPSRLDELFRDSDLLWAGRGKERIAFAFPEDLDLFPMPVSREAPAGAPAPAGTEPASGAAVAAGIASALPPDAQGVWNILSAAAPGRLDFQALAARCPLPSDRIADALWELAWRGRITNDTFAAVRKGIESGFKAAPAPSSPAPGGLSRRRRFQNWKAGRPLVGDWLILEAPEASGDALEREELSKDRVRQLLRRYGVLFRGLLANELPALQWPAVFRSLRLLELSGEVLSGHFFAGIPGLQFISPQALRVLENDPASDAVYWMSAADPASPCALGLEGLPYSLPPRLASTHLVFHGADLALVSRRMGRDLALRAAPRHKYLGGYLAALRHLTERAFLPAKSLEVETVNGEPVMGSPYLEDLLEAGFEKGIRTVTLRKRY